MTPSQAKQAATYSESTSEGKVRGTARTLSHRAFSLVQVQPAGHRACFTLRPFAASEHAAATQSTSGQPRALLPAVAIVPLETRNFSVHKKNAPRESVVGVRCFRVPDAVPVCGTANGHREQIDVPLL